MKPKWSRFHDACLNCGTRRTPHQSNGYCKRCWPMVERIRRAEKWNRRQPESWMPSIPRWTRDAIVAGLEKRLWSDEEFERYRSELIRQYRVELTWLRQLEQSRHEKVTGWDIEAQLRFVLSHVRPKATQNPFHGIARSLEDRFDSGQLSIIYGLCSISSTTYLGKVSTQKNCGGEYATKGRRERPRPVRATRWRRSLRAGGANRAFFRG